MSDERIKEDLERHEVVKKIFRTVNDSVFSPDILDIFGEAVGYLDWYIKALEKKAKIDVLDEVIQETYNKGITLKQLLERRKKLKEATND